jgi:BlaI family penicillinase repressor
MPDIPKISDGEWPIMKILWSKHPRTTSEIIDIVQAERKIRETTIRTFLRRLVEKGAVGYTLDPKAANLYHYHPLVEEQDCTRQERRHFLELYYKNNVGKLVADFASDTEISDEEIEKLKQMLDAQKRKS